MGLRLVEFTSDKRYRYRLTVTDLASRHLVPAGMKYNCRSGLFRWSGSAAGDSFGQRLPFPTEYLFSLSSFRCGWPRLGISIERIEPAHTSASI